MLLGKILNFGFWLKRATIDKPKLHNRCEPDRLKINTLVCHATPDRTFVTDFAYPVSGDQIIRIRFFCKNEVK